MNELLMPEVEASLEGAVRRRAARGAARSRRFGGRAVLITAAAIVMGGTALAATTTPWRPVLGDEHRGHARTAPGPVPAPAAAALAVLRRPQTEADRGPEVEQALRLLGESSMQGVQLDGVRLLARGEHGAAILIPVRSLGPPDRPDLIERDQICLMQTVRTANGDVGAGAGCAGVADLRKRGILSGGAGLVPDGVAAVEIDRPDGTTLTVAVHDNYFDAGLGHMSEPVAVGDAEANARAGEEMRARLVTSNQVRWLDAAGNEVPKGAR